MAIYNRWGDEVTIVVNCGEVRPKQLSAPATLVKVRYGDGSVDRFQFADFLKADRGWQEIKNAIDALPKTNISCMAMKLAIREAL